MAMPESSPHQCRSVAAAIAAAALPAAATYVRPLGGEGRCGATICSGSAASTAARKLLSSRARTSGELALRRGGAEGEEFGISLAEDALDFLDRHVGKLAAPAHVLHVAPVVLVERMVAQAVGGRVIERDCLLAVVGAFRVLRGKCAHRRMVAVDETSGLQILVHRSSFMSLRAPRKRAPAGSARPSTTEKWLAPGIGISPAKAPFQRSPRSTFCRRNSLDSSPPTQVISGARVAGGMKAGDSLSAVASSRRRSTFSQSTPPSGRRS